jgi:hypothetical protein
MSKGHIDAAAGGAFLSLTIDAAKPSSKRWWPTKVGERSVNNKKACIP